MKTCLVKVTVVLFLMSTVATFVYSQDSIAYRGIAKNSKGKTIDKEKISLRFTFNDSISTGKLVYQETQNATTDGEGSYQVTVGKGTPVTGKFSDINWTVNSKFMMVELDSKGGNNYTVVETKEIKSVPAPPKDTSKTVALVPATDPVAPPAKDTSKASENAITASVAGAAQVALPPAETKVVVKPVMLPKMTQAEIDAVAALPGMVIYNTTLNKAQIYAEIDTYQDQINEIFAGTSANSISYSQTFIPSVNGHVASIDVLVKDHISSPSTQVLFGMPGYMQNITMGSYPGFTWFTIILTTPQYVVKGKPTTFSISTYGVAIKDFGTNSLYVNGEGCCWLGEGNDLVFRIHVQPTPGSVGWQNMH